MTTKNQTILVILAIALLSCMSKSFDSKQELMSHLQEPENGYLQTKQVQGIKYSLLYKPTDLLVDQELDDSLSLDKVEQLRKRYSKYLYFTLSMSQNNQELLNGLAGDRTKFGAMVNQLAFGMDQKVHLYTEKKDTIPMADFIYPRMYGMSRSTDILFVFPKEQAEKANTLHFTVEDLGFYTGEVKFKIPTNLINNQPHIKFQ